MIALDANHVPGDLDNEGRITMKNAKTLKTAILSSIFGAFVLVGTATMASAQNYSREYREWQRAQIEAQQRQMAWQRSHSQRDWRRWQEAQARAQQYQQRTGVYNNGYNNNGYYNNGYNNGYTTAYGGNTYRVYRNGSYYTTDSRGAELLRTAVQNGYSQGYQQGQIDRRYNRGYNYNGNSYYRSGTYGYQSYVARDQYQYYFQQGFQKGYEDGFYSRNNYGYRSGNGFNILSNVLGTILNLTNQ